MSILNFSYLKGFVRGYPFFVPFFSFFYGIIFQNNLSTYFSLLLIVIDVILITGLKGLSRIFYNYLNIENIPLLGIGKRPEGAMYCGSFVDENDIGRLSSSFGMPSGHAIISMTTCIFWNLFIIDNYHESAKRDLALISLNSISLLILFSRIWLGCHTVQQVIVGGIIGGYVGYYGYIYRYTFGINL
jgi:membrane-associated phospholipid phosphatase